MAGEAESLRARATASLDREFWLPDAGHHAFGVLRSGKTNDTLTVWPATAAAFRLLEPDRARQTLLRLASHRLTADWGARMLTTDSALYDPIHYNMGAVWPFVTGFVAWGHYNYGRPGRSPAEGSRPCVAGGPFVYDAARGHAEAEHQHPGTSVCSTRHASCGRAGPLRSPRCMGSSDTASPPR
jgi:glycogen debranching enzyme